ncbi:MAG: hypothetical protein AABW79_00560 [Nanoarchaeota archaeon]
MVKLNVIKDCGNCNGCHILGNMLMRMNTWKLTDEEFNMVRAKDSCGSCKRKPEEIKNYNAKTGYDYKLEIIEGKLASVPLDIPSPFEDLWARVDSGTRDLGEMPKMFGDKMHPDAIMRIQNFIANKVYEEREI